MWRAGLLAVTALALSACTSGAARVANSPHPAQSTTTAPQSAAPATSSSALDGKYQANAISFAGRRSGLVMMAGSPGKSSRVQSWFDRTTDGGRTWVAGPVTTGTSAPASQVYLTLASPRRGWASTPGLDFTTDAGRRWHAERRAPRVVLGLSAVGGSAWVDGQACLHECANVVYRASRLGAPLIAMPHQPPTGNRGGQIVRVSASDAVVLVSERLGRTRIEATTTSGRTWRAERVPCPATTQLTQLAGGARSLWLACTQASMSMCGCDGAVLLYRSADLGRTWVRAGVRPTRTPSLTSIRPVNARVAWALDSDPRGPDVFRTTDGGHTWHIAVAVAHDQTFTVESIGVDGARRAWVAGYRFGAHFGRTFSVYRTGDGGRTWQHTTLPVPPGVPTVR